MDYSIALGVKPMQLDSPMNSLAQMLQIQQAQGANQLNALKMDEYKRSVDEQNQLRSLFATPGFDIAKPEWQQRAVSASPTGGMAFIKNASELAKSGLESEKIKQEIATKRAQAFGGVLVSVHDDPSDANVLQGLSVLDATGYDTSKLRAVFSEVADPKVRQQIIKGIAFQTPDGRAALEAIQPKFAFESDGKVKTPVPTNPLAPGYKLPTPITMTTTPGEDQTDRRTVSEGRLNRGATAENARLGREQTAELAAQAVTYKDTDEGTIALPSKLAPGSQPVGRPAVGADGKPLQGKTSLTETQGNATNFAARMKAASEVLNALEDKGVSTANMKTMAAGSNWTNWAASPEGRQYNQAAKNWVSANLRKESGAAIPTDEMAQEIKKYFPQPSDDQATIAQKRQARAIAEEGMMVQAGPGAKTVKATLEKTRVAPPRVGEVRDGHRYNGGNPADPNSWEKL